MSANFKRKAIPATLNDRVQLQLHFDRHGLLIRTEFACPGRFDDNGVTLTPLIATYPDNYKYSRGLRSLCAIILRSLISSAAPIKSNMQLDAQRSAVFNILKKAPVMASTGWIVSIFGYTENIESCLPLLMLNRGSDRHPLPQLRPEAEVSVWKDAKDVSTEVQELAKVLDQVVHYGAAPESSEPVHDYGGLYSGYYVPGFISSVCSQTMETLSFLVHRNLAVTDHFTLDNFRTAVKRGVKIRTLALSSSAPHHVLNEALRGIPRPVPRDEEALSRQLKEGESRIARAIETIGPNLQYRGYCRVPIQHFVISDNTIYAGFCTFDREAQQEYFDQRLYMQIDRNTPLGNQFIKQFEAMWSEGQPPTVSDT